MLIFLFGNCQPIKEEFNLTNSLLNRGKKSKKCKLERFVKFCPSKIYKLEKPVNKKHINCKKNLSICRLLLLTSSSSWDFCWMQSTHIENGSGGIFYHLFKCPTFTFLFGLLYFHFLLNLFQMLYFLLLCCFTFTSF